MIILKYHILFGAVLALISRAFLGKIDVRSPQAWVCGTWCFSGGKWMDVEKLMENGPFIGDFPIKTSTDKGVSIAMFHYQTV